MINVHSVTFPPLLKGWWMFAVLQGLHHPTLSQVDPFWCDGLQEGRISAMNGRNISLRFTLKDALVIAQSLTWIKDGDWVEECDRSLECIHDDTSLHPRRYTISQLSSDTEFELVIAFVDEDDSGTHIVKITEVGTRYICTVLILNLTIEVTPPVCSATVDREGQNVQMSCQWLQVNVGDQAQLVAGNQVLYEYYAPETNITGSFTLINKFSVYVDPEFIFEDRIVPAKCVVSHTRRRRNKTCTFPPVERHMIQDSGPEIQQVKFEYCTPNILIRLSWWLNSTDDLQSVSNMPTELVNLGGDCLGNVVFYCGEEVDSSTILVHGIRYLAFPDHRHYNIVVSASESEFKQQNDSTDELRCETIIVNVSNIETPSANDVVSVTQENGSSSNCVVSEVKNATADTFVQQTDVIPMGTILLSVLVLSTLAHGVSIIAFVYSFRNGGNYDVKKRE